MRVLHLFSLASVASAVPTHQLFKKDVQDLVESTTDDTSALINGDGSVVKILQGVSNELTDIVGAKKQKRDLQDLLNGATNDATALVNGDGSVTELVNNLLNNLGDILGVDSVGSALGANVNIGKRMPGLIDLDVSALQNLQGLLQQIQELLSSSGVTSEVNALLGEVQSLVGQLGLKKRSVDLDVSAVANIDEVSELVDNLLGQVNGLLEPLNL